MNVITCNAWVRKGVAANNPEKIELNTNELEKIIKQTESTLQVDSEDTSDGEVGASGSQPNANVEDGPDEYNFGAYDNESDSMYCHIANIASFGEDGKDPLITNDDEDSDKEDDIIKNDDNLLLFGHVEGDACILEVFVYNEREGSFYCHHDVLLSSIPLCIEWLNYDYDSKPGNLCAIGNMSAVIEIWDLDVMNCLEPAYTLGCKPNKKKKKKRVGHKKAVLDVAWNCNYTHVLASGSVDQTVLLWDLESREPVTKYTCFDDKVQAVKWHPTETHRLLTGCADKMIRVFDCKEEEIVARGWAMSGEVERVLWNHYEPNYCLASTDNGYIECFDVRADKPLWQIKAHEKEVTGLSLSRSCRGMLVSCSHDGTIKVWDLLDHSTGPVLAWEQTDNLGALYCLAANPDNEFIFALGGDNKEHNFKVLDFMEIPAVKEKFINAIPSASSNSATVEGRQEEMDVDS